MVRKQVKRIESESDDCAILTDVEEAARPPVQPEAGGSLGVVTFYSLLEIVRMVLLLDLNSVRVIDSALSLIAASVCISMNSGLIELTSSLKSTFNQFIENYMILNNEPSEKRVMEFQNMIISFDLCEKVIPNYVKNANDKVYDYVTVHLLIKQIRDALSTIKEDKMPKRRRSISNDSDEDVAYKRQRSDNGSDSDSDIEFDKLTKKFDRVEQKGVEHSITYPHPKDDNYNRTISCPPSFKGNKMFKIEVTDLRDIKNINQSDWWLHVGKKYIFTTDSPVDPLYSKLKSVLADVTKRITTHKKATSTTKRKFRGQKKN